MKLKKILYPKFDPGTYHTRELYQIVSETKDLRPVWAHKNALKWKVDYTEFLALCEENCPCCGSALDYGLGKNNVDKADIHTPSTDHLVPRSMGGTNDIVNLWVICSRCNLYKNNSTATDIHRFESIVSIHKRLAAGLPPINIDD